MYWTGEVLVDLTTSPVAVSSLLLRCSLARSAQNGESRVRGFESESVAIEGEHRNAPAVLKNEQADVHIELNALEAALGKVKPEQKKTVMEKLKALRKRKAVGR